jgi:hypothetical protein
MRKSGHANSFESPDKVQQRRRATERAQEQGKKQSSVQSSKQEPQAGASGGEFRATNNQPNNGSAILGDVKELVPITRHATVTADHLVRNVRGIRTGSEVSNRNPSQGLF